MRQYSKPHVDLLYIYVSGPNLGSRDGDMECKIAMFWVLTVQQDGVKVYTCLA